MKKIFFGLLSFIALKGYAQTPNMALEIKGNTVSFNNTPRTNGGFVFPRYSIIDENGTNGTASNYIDVKNDAGVIRRITINSIASFKVDGVTAPISFNGIRDSLTNHAAFSSAVTISGGGGSGTATSTAALQSDGNDSLGRIIALIKKDTALQARQLERADTAIKRADSLLAVQKRIELKTTSGGAASSDSDYIQANADTTKLYLSKGTAINTETKDTLKVALIELKSINVKQERIIDSLMKTNLQQTNLLTKVVDTLSKIANKSSSGGVSDSDFVKKATLAIEALNAAYKDSVRKQILSLDAINASSSAINNISLTSKDTLIEIKKQLIAANEKADSLVKYTKLIEAKPSSAGVSDSNFVKKLEQTFKDSIAELHNTFKFKDTSKIGTVIPTWTSVTNATVTLNLTNATEIWVQNIGTGAATITAGGVALFPLGGCDGCTTPSQYVVKADRQGSTFVPFETHVIGAPATTIIYKIVRKQ